MKQGSKQDRKRLQYDGNESFLLTPVTNPAQLRGTESLRIVAKNSRRIRKRETKKS